MIYELSNLFNHNVAQTFDNTDERDTTLINNYITYLSNVLSDDYKFATGDRFVNERYSWTFVEGVVIPSPQCAATYNLEDILSEKLCMLYSLPENLPKLEAVLNIIYPRSNLSRDKITYKENEWVWGPTGLKHNV